MSLKKFLKTVAKHGKEHTKTLFNPKRMHEHLKSPTKDHFRQYKEFTATTVGKVVFAAVAWFVGGLAVSKLGGGASATVEAGGSLGGEGVAAIAGQSGAAGQTAGQTALSAGASNVGTGVSSGIAQGGGQALSGALQSGSLTIPKTGGFWAGAAKAAKGAGAWAKDNPELVATIAQGVSSMATPDEMDLMDYQEQQRLENIERQNQNLSNVSQVNLGLSGAPKPLRDQFGNRVYSNQGGLIRRKVNLPSNPYREDRNVGTN